MYLKSKMSWNVTIPPEKLEQGSKLSISIFKCLMGMIAAKKATKELGYFLAATTIENIGEGKVKHSGEVVFPVDFTCITFKMLAGEVLEGTAHKIQQDGIFLNCGPCGNRIFLSPKKMADYLYVPGENPYYMNENSAKIEKGTVVRFMVFGTKFIKAEDDFKVLASLEGDCLGPISLDL